MSHTQRHSLGVSPTHREIQGGVLGAWFCLGGVFSPDHEHLKLNPPVDK